MKKIHDIPTCPRCHSYMGLGVNGQKASWICPTHGAQVWMDVKNLNGCYAEAKIGGSD